MSQETFLPWKQVVQALRQLCGTGRSGTAFITTPDNRGVRIVLQNGRIVSIAYQNRHGIEALGMLAGVQAGRVGFNEGFIPPGPGDSDLPVTLDLLELFDRLEQGQRAITDSFAAIAEPVDRLLARSVVEEELIEYLGPMASFACEEEFTRLPVGFGLEALVQIVNKVMQEAGASEHAPLVNERVLARMRAAP